MSRDSTPHIFVVDDEHFILNALKLYFESNDFRVSAANSGDDALEVFRREHESLDVVVLDLVMPGWHGLDLLRTFKRINPKIQVIIATGCGSMGSAVEALRLGASDFITKPILDFDRDLMGAVRKAIEAHRSSHHSQDTGESWLSVFRQLEDLASGLSDMSRPGLLNETWNVLREGFGAEAAIVAQSGKSGGRQILQSWTSGPAPESLLSVLESPYTCALWPDHRSIQLLSTNDVYQTLILGRQSDWSQSPESGPLSLLTLTVARLFSGAAVDVARNSAAVSAQG